jgi:hypothetical protein
MEKLLPLVLQYLENNPDVVQRLFGAFVTALIQHLEAANAAPKA